MKRQLLVMTLATAADGPETSNPLKGINVIQLLKQLMIGVSLAAAAGLAVAGDRATKDEAKAMVDAAAAYVGKVGLDKAKVDFMDKGNSSWHQKDLYVFVMNSAGVNLAHGGNEKMVGKELIALKDATGREYIKDMLAAGAKGSGWVDYVWQHPESKKLEDKSAYLRRAPSGDAIIGVGYYK